MQSLINRPCLKLGVFLFIMAFAAVPQSATGAKLAAADWLTESHSSHIWSQMEGGGAGQQKGEGPQYISISERGRVRLICEATPPQNNLRAQC